ncbi:MAG: WhiB family transcriptional regulator [Nocardioides sp.]
MTKHENQASAVVLTEDTDTEWMRRGACVTVALPWVADTHRLHPHTAGRMQRVCATCPVLDECAVFAVRARVSAGWWAGGNHRHAHRLGHQILNQQAERRRGDAA